MNNLEKEVLKLIGENTNTPDVFDATGILQIRDSLNAAVQQLCMVTGSYTKKYYLPLRTDARFYRMEWKTDHFGYVVNCWDRKRHKRLEQTDLLKLSAEDPIWINRNGFAEKYFHIGYEYLGIYMRQSQSDTVLELDCVVIPKAYTTDTDPVKLRESFERAAVQFAVSEYFASRGDAERATKWINSALETSNLKRLNPTQTERKWQWQRPSTIP
jgi:hypothetical protein